MSLFTIDPGKCTRDGICVDECPLGIIELADGVPLPTPVQDADERCIKCGHCVAVCPHGALSLVDMNVNDCPPVSKDKALSAEQTEYFLRSRRSIRSYLDKHVDRKTLNKLIEVASYAPTGTNSQRVEWLAIDSRDKVAKMSGMVVDLFRFMIANKHPMAESYHLAEFVKKYESGNDIISRSAPALIVAHSPKDYPLSTVDCTIALSYLDLAAPSFSLGTCWGGFFMMAISNWPPLQKEIALPEGHGCFGAMMIGYPKYKYHRLPLRKQPSVIWM